MLLFFSSSKLNIIDRWIEKFMRGTLHSKGSADKHGLSRNKLSVHVVISLACRRRHGLFIWKLTCQNHRGVS